MPDFRVVAGVFPPLARISDLLTRNSINIIDRFGRQETDGKGLTDPQCMARAVVTVIRMCRHPRPTIL